MDEQQDVIAELGDAGVLAGVRWAYESATRRALETYSEADGLDLDVLYAELSDQDLMSMPRLPPGLVRRCDLHGSAGWGYRGRRLLLASGEFGGLATLPW